MIPEPIRSCSASGDAVAPLPRRGRDAERWDDGPPGDCDARDGERKRVGLLRRAQLGRLELPRLSRPQRGLRRLGQPRVRPAAGAGPRLGRDRHRADLGRASSRAARHYRDVDIIHHDPEHPESGRPEPSPQGRSTSRPRRRRTSTSATPGSRGCSRTTASPASVRSLEAARAMGDALGRDAGQGRQPAAVRLADDRARRGRRRDRRRRATATPRAASPTPARRALRADAGGRRLEDGHPRRRPRRGARASTGEPRSATGCVRYADALVAAPRTGSPTRATPCRSAIWRRCTGDDRYREPALGGRRRRSRSATGARRSRSWGRTGFRLLGAARPRRRARPTPAPAASSSAVGARTATTVTVARSACPACGAIEVGAHRPHRRSRAGGSAAPSRPGPSAGTRADLELEVRAAAGRAASSGPARGATRRRRRPRGCSSSRVSPACMPSDAILERREELPGADHDGDRPAVARSSRGARRRRGAPCTRA